MSAELKTPRGIYLEGELIAHPAFIDLGGAAPQVYALFLSKRVLETRPKRPPKRWRPRILNNGEITFYYSEAVKRGITRPRFLRAIGDLVEHGFIDITRPGNGYARIATLYAISDRWRKWGASEFIEAHRDRDTRNRAAGKVGNEDVPCAGNEIVPCGTGTREA